MNDANDKLAVARLRPDLQVQFWSRLQLVRNECLAEALASTVVSMNIAEIDAQLASLVGSHRLGALAAFGLRGELVYPVPCILEAKPALLGYYRLLYGFSQKEFYKPSYFGRFKAMEARNSLSTVNRRLLEVICQSLIETGGMLVDGVQPITQTALHELQLLTLGPQLRGSQNNTIGQGAIKQVFELIKRLVGRHLVSSTETVMSVKNAAGRIVQVTFAPDPDIAIIESLPTISVPSVSIEIKGGADKSNIHNRLGEAEKSHQKAKANGFTRFWTIVKATIDPATAKRESPTTNEVFSLDDILDEGSDEHQRFRQMLWQAIGIN